MNLRKKPWAHDAKSNDYLSERFYGSITIPPRLDRPETEPMNQGDTTRCAAYAASHNGELIYGMRCSPDWQTNKIGRIQGHPVDGGGSDPNAAMDSQMYAKEGGYLPQLSWNPANPQSCDVEAQDYGDYAYIKPSIGKDAFDSICMEIVRHFNEVNKLGAGVQMFTEWHDTFNGAAVTQLGNILGYHSYLALNFDRSSPDESQHTLRVKNNYGGNMYDKGYQNFSRPVVNALLSKWGNSCKIPSPLTEEQRKLAKEQSQYGVIERAIINLYYRLTLFLVQTFGL